MRILDHSDLTDGSGGEQIIVSIDRNALEPQNGEIVKVPSTQHSGLWVVYGFNSRNRIAFLRRWKNEPNPITC